MTDNEYFARRAEQEASLAVQATNPDAVAAHYQMSSAYLDRIYVRADAVQVQSA
jgi:hypothetical protein